MRTVVVLVIALFSITANGQGAPPTEWICRVELGETAKEALRERYGRVIYEAVKAVGLTPEAAKDAAFMACYREPFTDECYFDSCSEVPAGTFANQAVRRKASR